MGKSRRETEAMPAMQGTTRRCLAQQGSTRKTGEEDVDETAHHTRVVHVQDETSVV